MRRLLSVVAGLAIALAAAPPARALCIATEASDVLVSPAAAVLPADGGILVGWETVPQVKRDQQSTAWKVRAAGTPVRLVRTTLAPGLVVLRPPAGTTMLTVTKGATELARYTRGGKVAPFAAAPPEVTSLVMTSTPARYDGWHRVVAATLSTPVPGDVVGVITYATRNHKRVAISFAHVLPGSDLANPFADAGRCAFNPPGMEPPRAGEKVTLVWVDEFGRLSKPSKPIAMTVIEPNPPVRK